jgi:hypothetical protein
MKPTQILYLLISIGILIWVATSSHLLDKVHEGFQSISSEPIIAKGLKPVNLPTEVMANPLAPGSIPFAPYGQTASVGSFPYQDPSLSPAELTQIKKLNEDLRSFLVFEGATISGNSDPTVQLPLTQLRADSQKLQQEASTLTKNPGISSTMTQQDLADIEGALAFLQRKVRLFETADVISDGSTTEGFRGSTSHTHTRNKTKATRADLLTLQTKIYAAILVLSSSGTTDPVTQTRTKKLQDMYSYVSDMITKLDKGLIKEADIPVYKEDITVILPNLADPKKKIDLEPKNRNGTKSSILEKQLSGLVGEDNAPMVMKNLIQNGTLKVNLELGYNVKDKKGYKDSNYSRASTDYSQIMGVQQDGTLKYGPTGYKNRNETSMRTAPPFDPVSAGMDDTKSIVRPRPGLDWKKRAMSICDQVRMRGLDPLDFGCIPSGSLTSPAYSWRGHTKMVCGRLSSTVDPDLPVVCGCPPSKWKGWSLSY